MTLIGAPLENYAQQHSDSVVMSIGDDETEFLFTAQDKATRIVIPVGYQLVAKRFFTQEPPTADELEYAINYIEDEIMKVAANIPHLGVEWVTNLAFVRSFAMQCFVKEAETLVLNRVDLERLFGEYAEIITGRPPRSYEPDISPVFYAQLLIFREYFHHLKFERITIISK